MGIFTVRVLTLLVYFAVSIDGQPCLFPLEWRAVKWFSNVVDLTIFALEFENDHITQINVVENNTFYFGGAFPCIEGSQSANWYAYVTRFHTTNNYYCEKGMIGNQGNALLRQIDTLPFENKTEGLAICPAILLNTPNYMALVEYPVAFTGSVCPFAAPSTGEPWQLSLREADGVEQCVGDPQSTARLTGNELAIDSCYTFAPTYEKPFKVTLTCLDNFRGSDMDGRLHPDDVIVFASTSLGGTVVYCGRYLKRDDDLQLSLYVGDATSVKCPVGSSISDPGPLTVTFTLKAAFLETTSGEGIMTSHGDAVTSYQDGLSLVPTLSDSQGQTGSDAATLAIAIILSLVGLGLVLVVVVLLVQRYRLDKLTDPYEDLGSARA